MKRVLVVLLSLLAVSLGSMALAGSARAHAELVSSSPEDGATLDAPPAEITFTFSEELLPDFLTFVASSPGVEGGELRVTAIEGPTATLAWPAEAPGGEWRVDYRVVSQDGHPIEGGITFTYAASSPTPTSTSPAPTSSAPVTPTASPTASPEPATATPSPETSPAASTTTAPSTWLVALGIAVLIAIVVGIIMVVRRRS